MGTKFNKLLFCFLLIIKNNPILPMHLCLFYPPGLLSWVTLYSLLPTCLEPSLQAMPKTWSPLSSIPGLAPKLGIHYTEVSQHQRPGMSQLQRLLIGQPSLL